MFSKGYCCSLLKMGKTQKCVLCLDLEMITLGFLLLLPCAALCSLAVWLLFRAWQGKKCCSVESCAAVGVAGGGVILKAHGEGLS